MKIGKILQSVCCVGAMAFGPVAFAGPLEIAKLPATNPSPSTNTTTAQSNETGAMRRAYQGAQARTVISGVSTPSTRLPTNGYQAAMDTNSRAMGVVASAGKAHAEKNASGKPAETPDGTKGTSSHSSAAGHSSNPYAQKMDTSARQVAFVADAGKAHAMKNASGKPSETPSDSKSHASSGSSGSSSNPIADRMNEGSRNLQVIASVKSKQAAKNGDKPTDNGSAGKGETTIAIRSTGHGHGGEGHADALMGRGKTSVVGTHGMASAADRASSHCHGHGECF